MADQTPAQISAEILQRKARRFQFLRYLYEHSLRLQDGQIQEVSAGEMQGAVGISAPERSQIEDYLAKRGLIELVSMGPTMAITITGIDYVEAALTAPERPTQYFPPAATLIMNVSGGIHGSQVLQGSHASSPQLTVGASADVVSALLALVGDIRTEIGGRSMTADRQEAEADLVTIEAQARSPKPKWTVIREALVSTRSVVEGIA